MRISDNQRYRISNHRVNIAKSDNQHKMEQISTQKRINRVSDDPVALGRVIKYKSGVKDMEQFQRNIEFTKGYIERSEASLSGINFTATTAPAARDRSVIKTLRTASMDGKEELLNEFKL